MKLDLIKYRDAGMETYTYFWVDENNQISSPFFNSEVDATAWSHKEPRTLEDARAEDEEFHMIRGLHIPN